MTISVGGSGNLPRLAPDLTYPSDVITNGAYKQISGIDGSSGLTTALSLTGKYAIYLMKFSNVIAEEFTFKLTVDGVIIINDTYTLLNTGNHYIIGDDQSTKSDGMIFQCNSSFLLEVATTTDTNVTLTYSARPIL